MEEDVIVVSTVVSRRRAVLPFGQRRDAATATAAAGAAGAGDLDLAGSSESGSATYDSTVPLGILRNEKRFNVALSRAKCLTMVVGNPYILKDEPCWAWLLEYAVLHNAYIGCALPPSLLQRSHATRMLGAGAFWESREAESLHSHLPATDPTTATASATATAAAGTAAAAAKPNVAATAVDAKASKLDAEAVSGVYSAPAVPAFLQADHATAAGAARAAGATAAGGAAVGSEVDALDGDADIDVSTFASEIGGDWRIMM